MAGILKTVRPLVLASGSLRRRDFLTHLGLDFKAIAPRTEVGPEPGEDPKKYSVRCCVDKGRTVAEHLAESAAAKEPGYAAPAIISADTLIWYDGKIIGKPKSCEENFKILCELAGNTHEVISSFCLLLPDGEMTTHVESTKVTFWDCPHPLLKAYAYSSEGMDKAGGYAIQRGGAFLASKIEGSITTVISMPLSALVETLLAKGLIVPTA